MSRSWEDLFEKSCTIGKWLWRFPRERSGSWHEVIASIYGTHPNGYDADIVVKWSSRCPWKAIAQGFHLFIHHTCLVVRNWEKIRFWEDLWLGDQPLCAQYTYLYRIILSRNLTISMVIGSSPPSTLNLIFRRNLTDSEIERFQGLLHLSPSIADSRGVFVFHGSVYGQIFSLGFIFASYPPFVSSS